MEGDSDPKDGQDGGAGDPPPQPRSPQNTPENGGQKTGEGRAKSKDQPSKFDRSLRATDIFIAVFTVVAGLAAVASATVAIWTADQLGATAAQTDKAIGKLATLADQTKRQADATTGQLGFLKEQVGEAKAQTKAISDQTAAIKSSAISAVRAAQAEIEAADAQAKSADSAKLAADAAAASNLPEFSLTSVEVNGLTDKPTSGGLVKVTIKPIFTNVGGGTAFPRIVLFKLIKENNLPETPDYTGGASFGGNEFPVAHTGTFYPLTPFSYEFSVFDAKQITEGKRLVVVIGYIDYDDGAHRQHHWCYAYAAVIPKGQGWTIFKVGPDPYHCQT